MNDRTVPAPALAAALRDAPTYRYPPSVVPGAMMALDVAALLASFWICFVFLVPYNATLSNYYGFTFIFVAFVYFFMANFANLFSVDAVMRPLKRSNDVLVAIVTTAFTMLSVIVALKVYALFPRTWLAASFALSFVAVMAGRFGAAAALAWLSRRRVVGGTVVVLGAGEQARRFLRHLQRSRPYFTTVVGVFAGPAEASAAGPTDARIEGVPVLGDVDALIACARAAKIDDVVVALPWTADRAVADVIERLRELPVNIYLSADLAGFELDFRRAPGVFQRTPVFEVVQRPISGWSSALKAVEDYVLAGAALILISPLLAIIALAVKLDTPGPVFFMQRRLGFNNQEFRIYKFRTMHHGRGEDGPTVRQATRNDPRVTRVGRFLRATSLDELPQLLNVLDGTMSLVGPRPHALSHNEEYGRRIRGYFARHRVKPGITGWAQVNGLRGETEQIEKMQKRIEHDIYYTDNWSILFDLKILAMTLLVVLFQKTAY